MSSLAPLAVAVPIATAAFLTAVGRWLPARVDHLLGIAAAATSAVLAGLLTIASFDAPIVYWFGGWRPRNGVALGISFVVDPLGAGLALLAAALVLGALLYAHRYFEATEPLFQTLMLLLLAGMIGMTLTGDLFNLFVFFELVSVPAFALTSYRIEHESPLQGAFGFGVVNSIGAFLILTGIGLLYGRTGALNLAQLGQAVGRDRPDGLVIAAFAFLVVGFLIKAGIVPFHFWMADAYAVAPTAVCVVFGGVMTELGLYALARVYWTVFDGAFAPDAASLRAVLVALGLIGGLVAATMCLLQRHLKRMLTYSVISHSGLFLVGVALLTPAGLAGTAVYLVAHGLAKGALFMCTGILLLRAGSFDELELRGRGSRLRVTAAVWLLGAIALTGPPFVGTFLGRATTDDAAAHVGYGWLPPVTAAIVVIATAPLFRVWGRVFLGLGPAEDKLLSPVPHSSRDVDTSRPPRHALLLLPAVVLVAASIGVGAWPGLAADAAAAAERFTDPHAYAQQVLQGTAPPGVTAHHHATTWTSVGWATVSTIGSVLLGGFLLLRGRLSGRVRRTAWRAVRPGVLMLRSVHSGHVGDYVAWLTFGTALLGAAFALTLR